MHKNYYWVESLKFIGIVAVILGHMNSPLGEFIYSWHMPLFFMISGFFITSGSSLKKTVIKDFKRLMVPYFTFSLLAILIESIKRVVLERSPLNYVNEFKAVFVWMDIDHLFNSYAFVLWFLPTLFFAKLIYRIIIIYFEEKITQLLFSVVFFSLSFSFQIPFAIDNAMNAVIWIFFGAFVFNTIESNVTHSSLVKKASTLIIISTLLMAAIYLYNGFPVLNVSLLKYDFVIFNFIWSIGIVLSLGFIFKIFFSNRTNHPLVKLWATSTMSLFVIHPYTNNVAYLVVDNFNGSNWLLQFFISILLLQVILFIRHFVNILVIKYV